MLTQLIHVLFLYHLLVSNVEGNANAIAYVRSFIELRFSPLPLTVDYETTATGYINITMKDYDVIYNSSSSRQPSTGSLYTVYPCCPNEQIAVILTNSTRFTFSLSHDQPWAVRTLSVSGLQIGRTSVRFYVVGNSPDSKEQKTERHFDSKNITKRNKRQFESWMHYTSTVFVAFSIAAVGGQLELPRILELLKKPVVITIVMTCQFIVMPLIGLGLVELVTPDPHIALSVLSFMCSPHEGAASLLILLSGSDVTLSFLLMNIINISSVGMFPIWSVIFEKLAGQDLLAVPYQDLLFTVSYTFGSAVIGLVMKAKLKRAYNTIWQHIPTLTTVTVVFMLVTEGYKYPYIYQLLTPTYLIVSCILAVAGFLFGFALSFICRQQLPIMTVVAIEMGCRSTHITSQLLDRSLEKPDNDIAKIVPVLCGFMSLVPAFVMVLFYMVYKRYNNQDQATNNTHSMKTYVSQGSDIMEGDSFTGSGDDSFSFHEEENVPEPLEVENESLNSIPNSVKEEEEIQESAM